MRSISHPGHPAAARPSSTRRDAFGLSRPVLLWALVLAVTMLSFYVHLLNEQMVRAQLPHTLPQPVLHAKAGGAPTGKARNGAPRATAPAERVATAR
jgi:hypothetical protein